VRTFAQQLSAVGYVPTFRPSPTTTNREFAPVAASNRKVFEPKSLETTIEALIEPLVKPAKIRRVQVTRTGNGFFKARYEGASDFAFGSDPREARGRVKMFNGSGFKESPVKEEDFLL
jgi:hypothetical protein